MLQAISAIEDRGRILIYKDEDSESRKELVADFPGKKFCWIGVGVGEGETYLWKELKMSHQVCNSYLRVGIDF